MTFTCTNWVSCILNILVWRQLNPEMTCHCFQLMSVTFNVVRTDLIFESVSIQKEWVSSNVQPDKHVKCCEGCRVEDAYSNWLPVIWQVRTCSSDHSGLPNHALCEGMPDSCGGQRIQAATGRRWVRVTATAAEMLLGVVFVITSIDAFSLPVDMKLNQIISEWHWTPDRVTGLIPSETTHETLHLNQDHRPVAPLRSGQSHRKTFQQTQSLGGQSQSSSGATLSPVWSEGTETSKEPQLQVFPFVLAQRDNVHAEWTCYEEPDLFKRDEEDVNIKSSCLSD